MRESYQLPLVAIVLVAFALRVFRVGDQSFWADEGYGLYLASLPLGDLGRELLVDLNHVPLYFTSLHFWIGLVGDGEFAVRFLSVIGGVLVVALTGRLGRVIAGNAVGLVAALLSMVAPFQVYYSQEARMHIWTTVFSLVCINALVSALRDGGRAPWVVYVLGGIAGLYTFYYAGFVLAGLGIAAMLLLILEKRMREAFPSLVAANVAIAVAFLPWVGLAASRLYEQAEHKGKDFVTYDLFSFLNLNLKTFVAGVTAEPDHLPWPIWPALLALGLGAWYLSQKRFGWLIAGYFVLPVIGVFLINLRFPHFVPRYLLLATPGFLVVIAAGLVAPWKMVGTVRWPALAAAAAAVLVMTLTTGQSLANNYFNPAYRRDDYRGVAHTIVANAQPDDAIILDAAWQIYNFPYYYRGSHTIEGLPIEDPLDPSITAPKLEKLILNHPQIWLVLYGNASMDPNGYVEQWLDQRSYKVDDSWYGTVRLARYITKPAPNATFIANRVQFASGLSLAGYEIPSGNYRGGDNLPVRLVWQTREELDPNFRASLRLVDSSGFVWSQSDALMLEGALPTDEWQPGSLYRDPRLIALPSGLPAGQYGIRLTVYNDDAQSETASQPVATIQVGATPASAPDPNLGTAVRAKTNNLAVVSASQVQASAVPGGDVLSTVAVRTIEGAADVALSLSQNGKTIATGPSAQITTRDTNAPLLVPLRVRVPATVTGGTIDVHVTTGNATAKIGSLRVEDRQRVMTVPPGGQTLNLNAGAGVTLASATIGKASPTSVSVRLVWQSTATPDDNLTAFVHIVDATGTIVAQADAPPGGTSAPSAGWQPNEVIIDERVIAVPAGSTNLRVFAGLYRASNGQRVGPGDGRLAVGAVP